MNSLILGDSLEELDKLEENSIDSIVTDPPYELNFMGKGWDNAGISFNTEIWGKCLRALKPGGHLLAFGGSRTYHRIACAIEDSGFEIRDTIIWLYGSGFPKSMNIGLAIDKKNNVESEIIGEIKEHDIRNNNYANNEVSNKTFMRQIKKAQNEWQGWGTCLKPAFEPVIVARKPFKGSLVDNIIKWGVGGLNIDECRVEATDKDEFQKNWNRQQSTSSNVVNYVAQKDINLRSYKPNGRFPANLILTYEQMTFDEVCGGFPNTKGNASPRNNKGTNNEQSNSVCYGKYNAYVSQNDVWGDSGSASRYFYCAKASKKDRDEGLEEFEEKRTGELQGGRKEGSAGSIMKNANGGTRVNPYAGAGIPKKNIHPTVKPTELMQYLIRLVTPNNGVVLDPFMGSGSTGKACMYENLERDKNYSFIGIEKETEYYQIAKARIEYVERKLNNEMY